LRSEADIGVQTVKAARAAAGLALNYAPFTDTLGGFDASLIGPSGPSFAPQKANGTATPKLVCRTLINPAEEQLSSRLREFHYPT
ncbi:MAG: hypothetical protein ACKO9H_12280, partial [Planctomycetota bacterium]